MTLVEYELRKIARRRAKQLCARMGIKYSEITEQNQRKYDAKKIICMIMSEDGFKLKHIGYALQMPEGNVSRNITTGHDWAKYSKVFNETIKSANYGKELLGYRKKKQYSNTV